MKNSKPTATAEPPLIQMAKAVKAPKATKVQKAVRSANRGYSVDEGFLDAHLDLGHDAAAGLRCVRIAIAQLRGEKPLSDDVRDYLATALEKGLECVENAKKEKASGFRGDAEKVLLEALGLARVGRRRAGDYHEIGQAVKKAINVQPKRSERLASQLVAQQFRLGRSTVAAYYQRYLQDLKDFEKVKSMEKAKGPKRG